jgi:O-methyltransferase
MIPSLQEVTEQRDAAMRELEELRGRLADFQAALRPYPGHVSGMTEWFLPPGAHLAEAPQRYGRNYEQYVERGGKMRPDDIVGYVTHNPHYAFDRARFYFFCLALDLVAADRLAGDLAELGVDKGNSASVLARGAQRLGKKIYLLDTFEGFSEQDLIGSETQHRGRFSDTSLELVQGVVAGGHVRFVKGHFPESAVQIPEDQSFCLVHLDCDLYKPFAAALDYFWPRLVPGGFLVIHDYTTLYWEGTERAVDEFFAHKQESIIPIPDMAGTVVVRKHKEAPGLRAA